MVKKNSDLLPPIHPGEILLEEFMRPSGLSINRLGRELQVPVTRIAEIVHGRRGISPDTASRLARYFGTTAEFWMNIESSFEMEMAQCAALDQSK